MASINSKLIVNTTRNISRAVISKQNNTLGNSRQNFSNSNWKVIHRLVSTTVKNSSNLWCRPPVVEAREPPCTRRRNLKDPTCPPFIHIKWGKCQKICLPCCQESIQPPVCSNTQEIETCCLKKPEYRIPSYAECRDRIEYNPSNYECCHNAIICYKDPAEKRGKKPMDTTAERQERILGQKFNTSLKISCRNFSTSTRLMGEECKKAGGELPCLKPSSQLGSKGKKQDSAKTCERLCMPCCEPARDPPECFTPYEKPPCTKIPNPRPAYSECKKDAVLPLKPCECIPQRPPPCGGGAGSSSKEGCRT